MKITGVFPRQEQVGAFIDSLKNIGFDRKDMIISDMGKSLEGSGDPDNVIDIKTEKEGLGEKGAYTDDFLNTAEYGILVTLDIPKKEISKVIEIMEEHGATNIIED